MLLPIGNAPLVFVVMALMRVPTTVVILAVVESAQQCHVVDRSLSAFAMRNEMVRLASTGWYGAPWMRTIWLHESHENSLQTGGEATSSISRSINSFDYAECLGR